MAWHSNSRPAYPHQDDLLTSSSCTYSTVSDTSDLASTVTRESSRETSSETSDSNMPDTQKLLEQKYGVDMSVYSQIEDLTHLVGPLTEDSVLRCLQARFYSQHYQNKVGPVVISVNSYQHRPSCQALLGPVKASALLQGVVRDAVTQHADTGHSQAIIVSGESGSGKTFCAMQLLRQLFDIAGGGSETDTFKHLSATLTVLQSLCSATTVTNPECSRVGMFIENFITDTAIYRAKIHAYLLDRERVCNIQRYEKNYHIFYQMLIGLGSEEKAKLHLTGYSIHNLRYLSSGSTLQNELEDKARFEAWKSALSILGIPFSDVMRVFSAVLLLGNIEFVEGTGLELDLIGNNEIKAVAALLGVSGVALYRGFTTRTRNSRGQVCKSLADVTMANTTRDALSKALYFRTVSAILKRANSIRRPTSNSTLSDSTESNLHQDALGLSGVRNMPLSRNPSLTSSVCSNLSKKTRLDGFISIVDMFGFETAECNRLEQLCINLCAETMQHFYNTHVFKSTMQSLREEGVQADVEVTYFDNEPILELLSSKRSGLINILETECAQPRTSPDTFVSKAKVHHRINNYFFEPLPKASCVFGIRHFAGRVVYDASNFLTNNRDQLSDDIICILSKQNCNFGFVSHLFARETKSSSSSGPGPKGMKHRILPSSGHYGSEEVRGTLSSDFQSKLDSLIRTLVHTKPHFIHCLKSNDRCEMDMFDKDVILRQLRSLQVLDTVQLMAGGIPHRMRYKSFNHRYTIFLHHWNPYQTSSQQEHCKAILNSFLKAMDDSKLPYVSTQWTLGKKHIFFSEGTRQQLEAMRAEKYDKAACRIQATWKGYHQRKLWPEKRKHLQAQQGTSKATYPVQRKRSKTKDNGPKKDPRLLQQASNYYKISLEAAPAVPATRSYNVAGNVRLSYPQFRIMKDDFPKLASDGNVLWRGEEVKVIGPASARGHLKVQRKDVCLDVPYHLLDLKTVPAPVGMDI
ncbi:myosin-IIIb-like [Ylistrum balloti]|uniref:myosin-IIIb-like n=1 Tax=Ylistrum balloti TaxID=509963 RepID=UPI002905DF57|nr:myosin-IIIb-like [Ylistrum balloti]